MEITPLGGSILGGIQHPEGNKVELWEPKIWDEKNKK